MFRVTSTVEQGYISVFGCLKDGLPRFWAGLQLGSVARSKFQPFAGIMGKPFAQFGAGGNVLKPGFHLQIFFFDTARPQPFHEKTDPIAFFDVFIDTFYSYHKALCYTHMFLFSAIRTILPRNVDDTARCCNKLAFRLYCELQSQLSSGRYAVRCMPSIAIVQTEYNIPTFQTGVAHDHHP